MKPAQITFQRFNSAPVALLLFIAVSETALAFPSWIGNCCSHPDQVTTGTVYAGDNVTFQKMLNQDYFGLHCEVNLNTGGGFSATQMSYGGNDSGNSWWTYTRRFAAGTVTFYTKGWEDFSGSTIFDSNGGANYSKTITALNTPTAQTTTKTNTGQMKLAWTRGVSGSAKDTLILRSTSPITTDPTQGTAYTAGNSIGGATVIYKGDATSFTDTGLTGGTQYYYKFYAENFSYYSAGVTATATANRAPAAENITLGVARGESISYQVIGAGKHSATDLDGDALAVTAVGTATSGTAGFTASNVTYTASGNLGTNTFTYTVSDGFGGADTKTMTVVVTAPEGFNRLSPPSPIGNGTVVLTYLGIPSYNYALDWATNLTPPIIWTALQTNAAATNGSLIFTNTSSEPVNFFRTRHVP